MAALGRADLGINTPPTTTWAMNSSTKVVREFGRFNEVFLIKLAPVPRTETQSISAEGILVYGALCPRVGCTIADWVSEQGTLVCDRHSSECDPRASGKVMDGPAARPLPALPDQTPQWKLGCAKPFAATIRFDE